MTPTGGGPLRTAAAYGRTTIKRIGEVFRMEDLTLGGIRRAVEWLSWG